MLGWPKYRRRPEIVEAIQVKEENGDLLEQWGISLYLVDLMFGKYLVATAETLDGEFRAYQGDYITRGCFGDLHAIPQEQFELMYEKESNG